MQSLQYPSLQLAKAFLGALDAQQSAIVGRWPPAVYRMWVRAYHTATDKQALLVKIVPNDRIGGVL